MKDPILYDPENSGSTMFVDENTSFSKRHASRRAFIKGVIASGAVAGSSSLFVTSLGGCSSDSKPTIGSIERLISLTINGQVRRVDVLPYETLAMTLRYKLALTGTKLGCDRGECGACTVIIDDVTHYSCSILTHSIGNRNVRTVEGLQSSNGDLHPVQQAFIDELGPQCGFCTPGMVMSAIDLLKNNKNPSDTEIRDWLEGNICRCTGYQNIVAAVKEAASKM